MTLFNSPKTSAAQGTILMRSRCQSQTKIALRDQRSVVCFLSMLILKSYNGDSLHLLKVLQLLYGSIRSCCCSKPVMLNKTKKFLKHIGLLLSNLQWRMWRMMKMKMWLPTPISKVLSVLLATSNLFERPLLRTEACQNMTSIIFVTL